FKNVRIGHMRAWMVLLFFVSIGIIAAGSYFIIPHPVWPGTLFYEPLNPAVLMLSVSVFMIVKLSAPKVPPVIIRIRNFAGKYNYGIYLGHALVLYFLDDPFGINYKMSIPILSIPVTALICFVLTLALVWLIRKMDIRLSSPYFMPGCRKVPDKQIAGDQYGISNAGVKYIRKVAVQQRYQRATGYAHNEERRADLGETSQVGDGQRPYGGPHQRVG